MNSRSRNKVPKRLQSIFWSQDVGSLDIDHDREIIILRVLAYGSVVDLRWLFRTYPRRTIERIFTSRPQRIFTRAGWRFVTDIIFRLRRRPYEQDYLKTTF